jgi:hypothetical protein
MSRNRPSIGCLGMLLICVVGGIATDAVQGGPSDRTATPAPAPPADRTGQPLLQAARNLEADGYTVIARDITDGRILDNRSLRHIVCKQKTSGKRITLDAVYTGDSSPGCPTHNEQPVQTDHLYGTAADFAVTWLKRKGVTTSRIRLRHADPATDLPGQPPLSGWTVCRISPGRGEKLYPSTATVELALTLTGTPCTESRSARPDPAPSPATPPPTQPDDIPPPPEVDGSGAAHFGRPCPVTGSVARTADGRPAVCRHGRDGINRWSYRNN